MKWFVPFFIFATLSLTACSGEDANKLPDTQPHVKGNITNLKKTATKKKDKMTTVLVEPMEGPDTSNLPKVSVKIDSNTIIQDQEGTLMRLEHLREGQRIEAWFKESGMQPYPEQVHASAIRVSHE